MGDECEAAGGVLQGGVQQWAQVRFFVEMMPSDVAEHLSQKISDGDQYEDVKEMILRYVETKADYDGNAMEVDNVELYDQDQHYRQHDDEGGLNMVHKGKGKGGDFYGNCNSCGVWGHRAADCPGKSSLRCYHCGQTGHRLSECLVKDAEMKGKGKGKYGKDFTNKGKGNIKGSDYKGSGKMGSFQNHGYTWNGGWKGKGGKDAGKGWSANAVWEEDAWEETPGAQTMQLFGVLEEREKVNRTSATTAGHARRTARNTLTAPPGLQLQNRFSVLEAEDDDRRRGWHPLHGFVQSRLRDQPSQTRAEVGEAGDGGRFRSSRVCCPCGDGTVGAKTRVRTGPDLLVGERRQIAGHGREKSLTWSVLKDTGPRRPSRLQR